MSLSGMMEVMMQSTVNTETRNNETSTNKYLTFELGSETYSVPLLQVQEIRTYTPATHIPNAPGYVLGVINLRGSIIAIIDLRTRLGMEPVNDEDQTIVVVVNIAGKTFGLRADSVSDVLEVADDSVQPPPSVSGSEAQRFLSGLVQVNDRVVIMLNIDEVIDLESLNRLAA